MMSSQVLVSRPHFDTRAVAQNGSQPPVTSPETTVKGNVYAGTSAGLATAGYRSTKYTPSEWFANNSALLNRAVADRNHAENICHESKALKAETDAGTLRTQTEGTKHLGERLQDIHRWRSELELLIERLAAETDLLIGSRRRLEKALDATEIPFAIATDNLTCRERRFGPDLVEDPVEEELLRLAEREEMASQALRRLSERVLQETAEDLRAQCATVDQAFIQRCMELSQAKTQLELHLGQAIHTCL